jgi:hypothetical protein
MQNRRASELVDKILEGDKPADIPVEVEQPTKFDAVINLTPARRSACCRWLDSTPQCPAHRARRLPLRAACVQDRSLLASTGDRRDTSTGKALFQMMGVTQRSDSLEKRRGLDYSSSAMSSSTRRTMERFQANILDASECVDQREPIQCRQEFGDIFGDGASSTICGLADHCGTPSKKNGTGTLDTPAICCSRLAPIRLAPFSYFCICWNVTPTAFPSFSWLIFNIIRRTRTRLPTCLSIGFSRVARSLNYGASDERPNTMCSPSSLPCLR